MTDQLTGVKNRHAYNLKELELNEKIESDQIDHFAIVICDINDLKHINDEKGHHFGDQCIYGCGKLICKIFSKSPILRIGGDEFAIILEGEEYESRYELVEKLNSETLCNLDAVGSTLATGISEYEKGNDTSVLQVFNRADSMMYDKKMNMKA